MMAGEEHRPSHQTFSGLMERAWCEGFGWFVTFDGHWFYQVPEMPRLGNVEEMERLVAGRQADADRTFFTAFKDEIVTVVSARRGAGADGS